MTAQPVAPMRPTLVVEAYGKPAPQGSKERRGRAILESSTRVRPWRSTVTDAAINARHAGGRCNCAGPGHRFDVDTIDGPVVVEITLTVPKPASAPKRRVTWPTTRTSGDVDKHARAILDALTDAGVWADDARVVELTVRKVYPNEGVDALPMPGALVRVYEVPA